MIEGDLLVNWCEYISETLFNHIVKDSSNF